MFFYGLTTLTLASIFSNSRIEKWIRWGFIINGIGCILSAILLAIGYKWVYLDWTVLISLTWYVYPLLGVLFHRLQPKAEI
jgi:hypothetical protein